MIVKMETQECPKCNSKLQIVNETPDEREHLECRNMECDYTQEVSN